MKKTIHGGNNIKKTTSVYRKRLRVASRTLCYRYKSNMTRKKLKTSLAGNSQPAVLPETAGPPPPSWHPLATKMAEADLDLLLVQYYPPRRW